MLFRYSSFTRVSVTYCRVFFLFNIPSLQNFIKYYASNLSVIQRKIQNWKLRWLEVLNVLMTFQCNPRIYSSDLYVINEALSVHSFSRYFSLFYVIRENLREYQITGNNWSWLYNLRLLLQLKGIRHYKRWSSRLLLTNIIWLLVRVNFLLFVANFL